jgi:hypothetical protein
MNKFSATYLVSILEKLELGLRPVKAFTIDEVFFREFDN